MISKQELINKINDPLVSDDAVFKAVIEFCGDQYDESKNIIELTEQDKKDIEEVGELARRIRPKVIKRLERLLIDSLKVI